MVGYTMYLQGRDYFFITNKKRKTNNLCIEICKLLNAKETIENINFLKYALQVAELKKDSFGGYDIITENSQVGFMADELNRLMIIKMGE